MTKIGKGWLSERRVLNNGTIVGILISIYLIYYRLSFYIRASGEMLSWSTLGYNRIMLSMGYGIFPFIGIIAYRIIYLKNRNILLSVFGSLLLASIVTLLIVKFDLFGFIGFTITSGIIYVIYTSLLSLALYLVRKKVKE